MEHWHYYIHYEKKEFTPEEIDKLKISPRGAIVHLYVKAFLVREDTYLITIDEERIKSIPSKKADLRKVLLRFAKKCKPFFINEDELEKLYDTNKVIMRYDESMIAANILGLV